MLLFFLLVFAHFVVSPRLEDINPYDDNRDTKLYLEFGCIYLARDQAIKYETPSIQDKVSHAYLDSCYEAVWPGSTRPVLPVKEECCLSVFDSFKKGATLAHQKNQPSLTALEDGHHSIQTARGCLLRYYHQSKPSMRLDILEKLSWPKDKDLQAFRDTQNRNKVDSERKKQPNLPNAVIKLNSTSRKSIPLAGLKLWIQSIFDLRSYDPYQLKSLRSVLGKEFPGITLNKIHKLGSKTRVLPLYDPFVLIPPNTPIASRYNPSSLEPTASIGLPSYSTIIAEFEHEGTTLCLVLSFDILTE